MYIDLLCVYFINLYIYMHMHSILTNKIPVSNKHLQGTILKFNFSFSPLFSPYFSPAPHPLSSLPSIFQNTN